MYVCCPLIGHLAEAGGQDEPRQRSQVSGLAQVGGQQSVTHDNVAAHDGGELLPLFDWFHQPELNIDTKEQESSEETCGHTDTGIVAPDPFGDQQQRWLLFQVCWEMLLLKPKQFRDKVMWKPVPGLVLNEQRGLSLTLPSPEAV